MECSICLNKINDDDATSKTVCGHTFHSKCIFTSIAYNNFSCPNCRKKLTDGPEKIKENETDEIIRSIIEIHSIPNISGNELDSLDQQEEFLYRRSRLYEPRDVYNERNVNNGIRVRRFRRFPQILPPIPISNETNNTSTTSNITREIVSRPPENSNIISFIFRSINNNGSAVMDEQD